MSPAFQSRTGPERGRSALTTRRPSCSRLQGIAQGPVPWLTRNAKTEVIEDAMMEMEPMEGLRQLLGVKKESHEYARSPRQ